MGQCCLYGWGQPLSSRVSTAILSDVAALSPGLRTPPACPEAPPEPLNSARDVLAEGLAEGMATGQTTGMATLRYSTVTATTGHTANGANDGDTMYRLAYVLKSRVRRDTS